jgi:aspartyl-tRNA(Asn)/glutamyl-tRNA(Gln) amidotransferase subunit A
LKPTYGRVSKRGVFPISWSLDTVGPIARTVEDAALLLNALAGHDPSDPTTARVPTADATADLPIDRADPGSLAGVRLGVPRPYFYDRVRPGVAAAVEAALDVFRDLGAEVVEVAWPEAMAGRTAATLISRAEGAAVHEARYRTNRDAYGPEMVLRIEIGRRLPAADYILALRARQAVKRSAALLFDTHRLDALVAPTTPETALRADHLVIDWDDGQEPVTAGYLRLTMPFNATGQPALSLPCGFDATGLPIGLQLAGKPFAEAALCRIGHAYERAAGWWQRSAQCSVLSAQ